MAQQGGLEGLGFTGPTDRLFLAILPDADVAARALALADGFLVGRGEYRVLQRWPLAETG